MYIPGKITFFIILTIFALILFYKYLSRHFDYWRKRSVPYVTPKFPYGNFQDVITVKSSIGDFIAKIHRESTNKFVGIWVFSTPHLVVRCPTLIKTILVEDFKYFSDRTMASDEKVDPICSQILFLVKNPMWKAIRSKISTIFSSKKLKDMTGLFDEVGKDMGHYLSERGDCVMNAREVVGKYTTDVIVSCVFGLKAGCFKKQGSEFSLVAKRLFKLTLMNAIRALSYFFIPPLVKIFKICFMDPVATNYLREVVWDTIKEREATGLVRPDMVQTIMELRKTDVYGDGKGFDGDRVVAPLVQMFMAGYETTHTTISFALYELSLNQQIQDKVRCEIVKVYNEYGCFNYETSKCMPYLDKVVAESLRKYPVLPYLDRRCMENFKIPGTEVVIEKGTPIYISVLGLHYDPKYYPNPHIFDPERFSGDAIVSSKNLYYMPFGKGPRNCIGARFGLLSTKIAITNLLYKFRVDKCEGTPETIDFDPRLFVLAPKGGLPLRFIPL